jgi:hypothetical protein
MTENDIPKEVHDFIQSLLPDDAGTETLGCWVVHFEGFSGICMEDVERRIALPASDPQSVNSLGDVLDEVDEEFRIALGDKFIASGSCGHEDEPIVYAVGYVEPETVI